MSIKTNTPFLCQENIFCYIHNLLPLPSGTRKTSNRWESVNSKCRRTDYLNNKRKAYSVSYLGSKYHYEGFLRCCTTNSENKIGTWDTEFIYIYIYRHTHIYICTHTYIYTHMSVCIYIYLTQTSTLYLSGHTELRLSRPFYSSKKYLEYRTRQSKEC